MKIYQISCGFRNSFFLTENRKIYYTGFMESGLEQNTPNLFQTIDRVIINIEIQIFFNNY